MDIQPLCGFLSRNELFQETLGSSFHFLAHAARRCTFTFRTRHHITSIISCMSVFWLRSWKKSAVLAAPIVWNYQMVYTALRWTICSLFCRVEETFQTWHAEKACCSVLSVKCWNILEWLDSTHSMGRQYMQILAHIDETLFMAERCWLVGIFLSAHCFHPLSSFKASLAKCSLKFSALLNDRITRRRICWLK